MAKVTELGLTDVTRRIMAEHPGEGDSVQELRNTWADKDVRQIYDTILAERARVLWEGVTTGANSFLCLWSEPSSSQDVV